MTRFNRQARLPQNLTMRYIEASFANNRDRNMTPEELNRAMEFIIQHLAHFSASLDREEEMRKVRQAEAERKQAEAEAKAEAEAEARQAETDRRIAEVEEAVKGIAGLQARVVAMIEVQTLRLDQNDDALRRHEEALAWFRAIFDRLAGNGTAST